MNHEDHVPCDCGACMKSQLATTSSLILFLAHISSQLPHSIQPPRAHICRFSTVRCMHTMRWCAPRLPSSLSISERGGVAHSHRTTLAMARVQSPSCASAATTAKKRRGHTSRRQCMSFQTTCSRTTFACARHCMRACSSAPVHAGGSGAWVLRRSFAALRVDLQSLLCEYHAVGRIDLCCT
jgi:hypothetical protein